MTDETNTLEQGGGEALAANTEAAPTPEAKPAPKSDAEAELREQEQGNEPDDAAKAAKKAEDDKAEKEKAEQSERKKNRTREYINRINRENAELRRQLNEGAQPAPQKTQEQPAADDEPTLENCDFDVARFTREHSKWAVAQALKERDATTQKAESTRQQQETATVYLNKVAEFAEDHPDFPEVVGSIPYPLSNELQAAIMAHERGPEIAYHLGNNDDEAFQLASIQPHLAAAAVERLASRLTAAPPEAPKPPAAPAEPKPKPISQAPAPVPTVSGRSPTETPPEKLTDDEWFKREREKSRKR